MLRFPVPVAARRGGTLKRGPFVVLALVAIGAGLGTRVLWTAPSPARDITGDALWAVMMFGWVGALAPRLRTMARAGAALAVCWLVEASQAYHAPAVDAWRATTVGHLILGSDFDARDLAAYAVGVLCAACAEALVRRATR